MIICYIMAYMLVMLIGCAGTQPNQATYPRYIYTQQEFRICISQKTTWFNPVAFRNEMREKEEQLNNMGAPGNVISEFKNLLPRVRGMELLMEREINDETSSFHYIGIQLKPDTRLKVQQGAFRVILNNPGTEQSEEVADEGVLVFYWVGRDRAFYDSSHCEYELYRELQNLESNIPLEAYIRLPIKYVGWTISGMILDPNRIQIVSK